MRFGKATVIAVLVFLTLGALASAGPRILSYQGSVLDAGGQPAPDGTYQVRFTLYDEDSTGSVKWSETDSVEVVNGLFSTILGDGAAFSTQFTNYWDLWLEVEVDLDGDGFEAGEVYLPRQRITSAVWAFDAERLNGKQANDFQRRVTGSAPAGSYIRAINADGTVVTGTDQVGTGDITGVTAGTGLTGGGTSGNVALSADPTYLQRRVTGSAPAGQYIRTINADGTVVTGVDADSGGDITAVTAGTGLTGGGASGDVALSADTTYLQRRVTGSAPAGQYVRIINADGTVVTGTDQVGTGDVTGVIAGTGLTGGGSSGDVTLNVAFNDDGTSTLVSRGDHAHAWDEVTSIPVGFADGIDDVGTGDITAVNAGNGLTGGGASGDVSLAVEFAGTGSANTAARSDHGHPGGTGWSLWGNAGTVPGTNFLGTLDAAALELHTSSTRVLRLEPNAISPNLIGGFDGNTVTSGVVGATIAGGGSVGELNEVTDEYGTIGGGRRNEVGGSHATVAGGWDNSANGTRSTVGGGYMNDALGLESTVSGGMNNGALAQRSTVSGGTNNYALATGATVSGGLWNRAPGGSSTVGGGYDNCTTGTNATIAGGWQNGALGLGATVGGGENNSAGGAGSTVGGGYANTSVMHAATVGGGQSNTAASLYSTVGGGMQNSAEANYATVGGGNDNHATGDRSTIAGGQENSSLASYATVGGGTFNVAGGSQATVAGGAGNTASATNATVGGGAMNTASAPVATIGGGASNVTSGTYATIPGGLDNAAAGDYSFAAGRRAKALHQGSFVWADSTDADFASSYTDQFLVRATGGVDFVTSAAAFRVNGYPVGDAGSLYTGTLSTDRYSAHADLAAEGYLGDASGDIAQNNTTLQTDLNADLLDGQHGSFYQNADNINAGTVSTDRYSAYTDLGAEGRLDNNDGADLLTRTQLDGRYYMFQWEEVAGTSHQAESNRGYVATNAAEVTITLPVSPTVGDVVCVNGGGGGAGGYRIAQNAGQVIQVRNLGIPNYSAGWMARDSVRDWRSIASSADGTKLVACVNAGQIYTSTDGGAIWTARDSNRAWRSVASSDDGTYLVACVASGQIYTSSDSGVSWTARESNRSWVCVASSADGSKLVACVGAGQIYTSVDYGVSWTPRAFVANWTSVASSADGATLLACIDGGQIRVSLDSGVTWTPRESNRSWSGVASSGDGTRMIACVGGGQIYTSSDAGLTWTPRESSRNWTGVACSGDGARLVACVYNGRIHTSSDAGLTWTPRASTRDWGGVCSSEDGTRLAACVTGDPIPPGGQLYTFDSLISETSTGTGGYLRAYPKAVVQLQYVGGDTFVPLSGLGKFDAK